MANLKKILITGGSGFIFGNFIRKLLHDRLPYEIVNVDKINDRIQLNLIKINKKHSFYLADVCDAHIMDRIFEVEKPDYVIHASALTSVDHSLKTPKDFIINNITGTQVITDLCLKYKVEKLILISTDEIYGSLNLDDTTRWTENTSPNPQNYYASSKYAAECIVRSAGKAYGLNFNITRSSNNYGRAQTTDKLIPRVIKCALEKQTIPVYGRGDNVRDWLFVIDNYSGIMKVLENGIIGETYNIGADQEYSNIEVVKMICDVIGEDSFKLVKFVEDRKGHDHKYSMSSEKLRKLDWKPNIKFKYGLVETVNWYLLNRFYLN